MAGAAVAALAFASKITNSPMPQLNAWKSQLHMIAQVKHHLGNLAPKVLVLGALGRSGRGAVDVLDSLGCQVTQWDLPETSKGERRRKKKSWSLFFDFACFRWSFS